MINRSFLFVAGCLLVAGIQSCRASKKAVAKTTVAAVPTPPPPPPAVVVVPTERQTPRASTEFRAAWVATVSNINWPSKKGLTTEQQQKEAIQLLDFLQRHHFNAVIFQIRPQADALYQSSLEPWSYFLTGKQGKAPDPYYDPLQFWIDAAHDRGLELHVWLNPYRAHSPSGGPVTDCSLVKKKSELVVKLKDGHWWFDPSKKGTKEHANNVVMDIVQRYDIDGVHFDDYFYPYPEYNGKDDFPDANSYAVYTKEGGTLSLGDWRRDGVNTFIEQLYANIKAAKPYVKFGLSPFGTYRPGYPAMVEGFDQYNSLYADARLWLNKGWIDYFTPQLYWRINSNTVSFPILLRWWMDENKMARHLWPGISVGRDTSAANVNEVMSQILVTRGMMPNTGGDVHWSISSLTKDSNLAKAVIAGPYKQQALVPSSPWLDREAPKAPEVIAVTIDDSLKINWTPADERDVFRYVVYYQYGEKWSYKVFNRNDRTHWLSLVAGKNKLKAIAVTAVDRTGNESDWEMNADW